MSARPVNRRSRGLVAAILAVATTALGLTVGAGAAHAAACSNYSSATTTCTNVSMTIGGTSYSTDWYQPNGTASALMLLEHGFSRNCGNLRNTSKAIAEKGVMVFCVNASMTGGNPTFGSTLGDALNARTIVPPNSKPLPVNYIVGGHSAGGMFASAVGARLNTLGYANLKGAVLFDAVAASGFDANLAAISNNGARPVLEVAARPSLANSQNNGFPGLAALNTGYVGIQLLYASYSGTTGQGTSCHIDVEGENSDFIGQLGAGCSANATNVARLRDFGSSWAYDLANGTTTSAYYCTDEDVMSTCGAKVQALAGVSPAFAATIET